MKRLYILRHAKSSWASPGLSDIARTLNKRGREQCELLRKWFSNSNPVPQHILCSPAQRTVETLERIQSAFPDAEISIVDSLYTGMSDTYLEAIWQTEADCVLIIGHNPTCDDLARHLTAPTSPAAPKLMAEHFGTAAIAALDFGGDTWTGLTAGSCQLVEFVRPKEIKLM